METKTYLLLATYIAIPLIGFTCWVFYLRSRRFAQSQNDLHKFSAFERTFVVDTQTLYKASAPIMVYSWLDQFLPTPLALTGGVLALMAVGLFQTKRVERSDTSNAVEVLLRKLNNMGSELAEVKSYIEKAGHEVVRKQSEITESEELRVKLEQEILFKSKEAEAWKALSEEQRQLIVNAAASAAGRDASGKFWLGLLLGFLGNILASAVWALMGNPGKDTLLGKLESIWSPFSK